MAPAAVDVVTVARVADQPGEDAGREVWTEFRLVHDEHGPDPHGHVWDSRRTYSLLDDVGRAAMRGPQRARMAVRFERDKRNAKLAERGKPAGWVVHERRVLAARWRPDTG